MARDPYAHAKEDLGNIREWLAGRGAGRGLGGSVPAATSVAPEQVDDAVAPLPRLEIAAEPVEVPKPAEPERNDACQHCGKQLPTLRSRDRQYCDRYCSKAARKARRVSVSG
jgi:hypothetical protein